jgi:serine/threonine protein kinase/Tol biopolymer transport system component
MTNARQPTDPVARLTGSLADRYHIEREIGAGGMATVYLARDIRHDRPVAIKVLRPELAMAIGPERFLAEIKTTAQLQHAHILGLIDSGQVEGTVFYVMPFIDGESLRQRLSRERQLPIADAVQIAIDVAGALDYAHRRGVIHRDIKPENILLHEGQPLVADFGIALAAARPDNSNRMTESGTSLGTPQYMSPEQAMGERTLDARTDIYALGCVLYEMLVGEPPFTGPSGQAIIAKVMTVEPEPVSTLRRSVPPNVAAATMMALAKVPADRFTTAADFAAALANPHFRAPHPARRDASPSTDSLSIARPWAIAAAALAVLLGGVALVGWLRPTGAATAAVVRFEIPIPDSIFSQQLAMSRDGSRLVWATLSGYYERRLDSLAIRRVRDAASIVGGVRGMAPGGGEVLVLGRGGSLAIVPVAGGPARTILASGARGGTWGTDGYIYFGLGDSQAAVRGLARMRADSSRIDTLVKTDAFPTEISVIPGGRGLIVTLARSGTSELDVLDLRTKTLRKLDATGSFAQFVEPGYVIFARGASIMAAPFDIDKLAFTRPPVPFLEVPTGGVNTLAATTNVLAYIPLPEQSGSSIVVRSRSGGARSLANVPDTLRFSAFTVSPDGRRFAAVGAQAQAPGSASLAGASVSNLYIYELSSGVMTRLRSDERDVNPAWLPNGRELSFVRVSTDTPITSTLMRRAWDGSSSPVPILRRTGGGRGAALGQIAWLPDGRHGIISVAAAGQRLPPTGDLMRFSLDAPAKLDTVVATEYSESNPAVSPDGQLLAFTSDESGRTEVYVRPVAGGALRRVSLNGGNRPKWSHSGRELFYADVDTLFAADIRRGPDLGVGDVKLVLLARTLSQGYAVLPGDTTFVTPAVPRTSVMVVITNFATELNQLLRRK